MPIADSLGAIGGSLGSLFGGGPEPERQHFGGSAAETDRMRREQSGAVSAGLKNAQSYFEGGTRSQHLGASFNTDNAERARAVATKATDNYANMNIGNNSAAQGMQLGQQYAQQLGQQLNTQAAAQSQAVGASLGGVAGARAATRASQAASIDAQRQAGLAGTAMGVQASQAMNQQYASAQSAFAQQSQVLLQQEAMRAQQAMQAANQADSVRQSQAALALGTSQANMQDRQKLAGQEAANANTYYDQKVEKAAAQSAAIGNLIGGVGGAVVGAYTGGLV